MYTVNYPHGKRTRKKENTLKTRKTNSNQKDTQNIEIPQLEEKIYCYYKIKFTIEN